MMLRELKVRDLALVAESRVRFGPGLNLLTGETGSGKSLIVDALGLTLGARGGADQVRHGAQRATVESVFDSGGSALVLERELGKRGGARIDGRSASPVQLRELGRNLVAVHGQQEYLRWQLEELKNANLRTGEDAELSAERAAVRHAARLAELGHESVNALHEDGIARAAVAVRSAADLDPRLAPQAARLAALAEEVADVAAELRRYSEALDSDPGRLEAIETRLAVLDAIKRKHGGSLEAAISEEERLKRQVGATEDLDGAVAAAERERDQARARLEAAAGRLTKARAEGARRMQKAVGADADRMPTLVFDEVDAGIGGEAATQVGLRLKALGIKRQVLVVTHLAQIASFADHHLLVEKSPGADGRNVVSVRELRSEDERAAELARMMSGGVTAKALARAHELLDEARTRK